MNPEIKHTNDASFEGDVLKADTPVLVDYWAEWCGPCRGIAPILDELATEYNGRLRIAKMNVDENQNIPAKYAVRSIPLVLAIKDGLVVDQLIGSRPKEVFEALVKKLVA